MPGDGDNGQTQGSGSDEFGEGRPPRFECHFSNSNIANTLCHYPETLPRLVALLVVSVPTGQGQEKFTGEVIAYSNKSATKAAD